MEFNEEIIKKLQEDGISFVPSQFGDRLTYEGNYGHATGIVYAGGPGRGCPHFKVWVGDKTLINKKIDESDKLEHILRSLAEATGGIDQAIEDAWNATESYDDLN
jgi:hypothetical protein